MSNGGENTPTICACELTQEYLRRMIHRVVAAGQVDSHGRNRKRLGHLIDGRLIPREPNEAGIKTMRVLADRLRRVPLWVDGYKQHLHSGQRRGLLHLRQLHERSGANVRAMREAKEDEAGLALQVLRSERVARRCP